MKYRKKPLTIEAVRWNGCNAQQIRDFVGDCVSFDKVREEDSDAGIPGWIDCTLHLSDCDIMVNIGDFIIKDGNGAFINPMEKKTRIEWVDGEEYCRFDGIQLTFYCFEDDIIIAEDTIYTDMGFDEVVKWLGDVHGAVEDYDKTASKGYGFEKWIAEKDLEHTVVIPLNQLDGLKKLKPYADFKADYPDFNIEKYNEVYDALNEYYDSFQKRGYEPKAKREA